MKLQLRRSAAPDHLDITPQHLLRVSRAERFHRRFLRGEPAGKMDRGIAASLAVGDLAVSEDATKEAITVTLDCCRNARYICGIEAETNDGRH